VISGLLEGNETKSMMVNRKMVTITY